MFAWVDDDSDAVGALDRPLAVNTRVLSGEKARNRTEFLYGECLMARICTAAYGDVRILQGSAEFFSDKNTEGLTSCTVDRKFRFVPSYR